MALAAVPFAAESGWWDDAAIAANAAGETKPIAVGTTYLLRQKTLHIDIYPTHLIFKI